MRPTKRTRSHSYFTKVGLLRKRLALDVVLLCSGLRGEITMSCILVRYIVARASSRVGTTQVAPRRMQISTRNVDLQLKPFISTPARGSAPCARPSPWREALRPVGTRKESGVHTDPRTFERYPTRVQRHLVGWLKSCGSGKL